MTNLQLRLLSAAVMVPVVFGAIIAGGFVFKLFVLVIYAISIFEWMSLSRKTEEKIKYSVFGFFYLSICFFEFAYLRISFSSGLYLTLTMMLIVWAADTGAYFIGRKFGRHKLAPEVSPNKSWEGVAGAIGASALILLILISFAHNFSALIPNYIPIPTALESLVLLLIGGAFGYVGQMGDLLESFMKRRAGVKDSGRLIPGHGGVLDRIDSLLLISPFFVLLATYVL